MMKVTLQKLYAHLRHRKAVALNLDRNLQQRKRMNGRILHSGAIITITSSSTKIIKIIVFM
jgi:hypothetical protein